MPLNICGDPYLEAMMLAAKKGMGLPLWYAHYDNSPSFSDFAAFGGWTAPNIKQYEGTSSLCGASVDRNWHP